MPCKIFQFIRYALLLSPLSVLPAFAQQPVQVVIETAKTGAPISKYIYGQFLEHGGNIVNEGVWAEMLEDRKFFNPITTKAPDAPPVPAWRRRGPPRRWTPIGGDEAVVMDTKSPIREITRRRSSSARSRMESHKPAWPSATARPTRAALFSPAAHQQS